MTVKVKVAKVHEEQLQDENIKRELEDIQKYFNSTDFNYAENTINFVFIKGIYSHIKRAMLVVGVYVNNTKDDIYGFSSKLRLKFINIDGQIATVNSAFDENFIGKLQPEEGMLIHLEVPVRGLNKDEEFSIKDIAGMLDEIKYVKDPLQ